MVWALTSDVQCSTNKERSRSEGRVWGGVGVGDAVGQRQGGEGEVSSVNLGTTGLQSDSSLVELRITTAISHTG